MSDATEKLLQTLDLETLEHNLFRGRSPDTGWQRVFGGQVIGQALVAAQRTVPQERKVHSLHGYFLRPGDPAVPIIYEVDRIRDGGSFTTRRVVGIQHGQAIWSMSASFQRQEDGLDWHEAMPDVTPPGKLPGEKEIAATMDSMGDALPDAVKRYWKRNRPIELRTTSYEHYLTTKKLPARQDVWLRATGPIPHDHNLQCAVLAYASDMTLLDTSLYPHGRKIFDPDLQVASLDHSMWFHRPIDVNKWHLYTQDAPNTSGSRGLTRGSLYTEEGVLIASVAQEGLIRMKDPNRVKRGESSLPLEKRQG